MKVLTILAIIAAAAAFFWPRKTGEETLERKTLNDLSSGVISPETIKAVQSIPASDVTTVLTPKQISVSLGAGILTPEQQAEALSGGYIAPTPEQMAAGAVPLASNYYDNGPVTLPGDTDYNTVMSYVWDRYHVSLRAPIVTPPEATPLADRRTGRIYGWQTPWTSSGYLVVVDPALVPASVYDWDPIDEGTHQSGPSRPQTETSGDVNQESEWSGE